ncbi:MAG: translesion error-prone DNA polymerase V autoproteolytic subunit [Marinifilaceae bacterium]
MQDLEFFRNTEKDDKEEKKYQQKLAAGFASPAEEFRGLNLDLNVLLVRNTTSTFYARVSGSSMEKLDLYDGDILIIDRSLSVRDNKLALCYLDGEFIVRRLSINGNITYLIADDKEIESVQIDAASDFLLWGIITYVIKPV